MANVNIATAYLSVIPSFDGMSGALDRGFAGAGDRVGEQFTRDINGKLRDSRGRFVREGENAGEAFSQGAERSTSRGGNDSGDSFLGSLGGKLKAGVAGVAAAAGAAFVAAWTEATDVKMARALSTAQLGFDNKALGETAGKLYATGYGESIADAQQAVTDVFSSIESLRAPDMAGELQKVTGQVLSFSDAFGVDATEAVSSVNTLINSGLAKDAPAALDLLTASLQQVPAALRGNVVEASDEYAQFFNTLGFSGDQAFGALVESADKGAFGIDKTGDAVKEFTILSTDMSTATAGAYEAIGLNQQDMTNKILAGGDTAKGAFGEIVDGILAIEDPATRASTAIGFFGTPLEDMNVGEIPDFLENLQAMSGGLGEVEGAAGRMDTAMGSTTSKFELMWREVKTKVVDFFIDEVMPAVAELAEWLGEKLAPIVEKVGIWFRDKLVPFLKLAWEWFEVNLLPALVRFGEFVAETFGNIMTVVDGIVEFISGVFQGDWERAWAGIKDIFAGLWDQILNLLQWAWDAIVELISTLGPKIGEILLALGDQLLVWGGELLGWLWQGMQDVWNNSIFPWFEGIWNDALGVVQSVWDGITGAISDAWNWVRDNAFTPLGAGVEAVEVFFSDLWATVEKVWQDIQDKISGVWAWINQNVFAPLNLGISTIGTFFSNLWVTVQTVWGNITRFFEGVAEGIATAVANVKKGIEEVKNLITGFGTALGSEGADIGGGASLNVNLGGPAGGVQDIGKFFGWWSDGGVLPGYEPGRDTMPAMLSKGEGILRPEVVRGVSPEWVYAANYAGKHGLPIPGFANGGIAGLGALAGYNVYLQAMNKIANMTGQKFKDMNPMQGGVNGAYGPENSSGLASNTAAARDFIMKAWGITNIGGWRAAGSVAGSDHPKGKALDVMIANYLSSSGIAQGNSVADWFVKNPTNFGTKYVIWRERINQGGNWSAYNHPGGNNDTLAHRDHVHISFLTGMTEAIGRAVGDAAGPAGVTGGRFSPMVERWRNTVLQGLSLIGQPSSLADTVLNQIRSESSGNPNAINLTDINAQRGYPSRGLVQTIPQTFNQYRLPSLSNNIVDPLANIVSGMRYAISRYGSIQAGMRGVAYDNGGMFAPGTVGVNLLNKPEAVLTPPETAAYQRHAQALEAGYSGMAPQVIINLDSSDPLQAAVAAMIQDGMSDEGAGLLTIGSQRR